MKTDTSEKGLESLIVANMTESGWLPGDPSDYDRDYAIDLTQLHAFLSSTQPDLVEALDLDHSSPTRQKFLARLQGEITKRGVIDVLRNGLKHGPHHLDLFYGTPSPGNPKAAERFAPTASPSPANSATAGTKPSSPSTSPSSSTASLSPPSNSRTASPSKPSTTPSSSIARDRDPRELLFLFGRCIVHFAVDDQEVRFCTHLKGKCSWFLPFNQGWNDGAGNPPNPEGLKTDYLWKRILTPQGLTNILENYAQVIDFKDDRHRQEALDPDLARATTNSTSFANSSPTPPTTGPADAT